MKIKALYTILILSFLLSACGGDDDGTTTSGGDDEITPVTATYTATVTTNFTEEEFPDDYPDNPSFGTIVAIVHAPEITVFSTGQLASDGFRAYVENNDVAALDNFINSQIGEENEGQFVIQTEGSIGPEDSTTFELSFSPTRTQVTFIANISPSPDWFVGVSSFDIVDGNSLIENETFGLRALDGGSSGGNTYNAPEEDENAPIRVIDGFPFSPEGGLSQGLGQIDITRVN